MIRYEVMKSENVGYPTLTVFIYGEIKGQMKYEIELHRFAGFVSDRILVFPRSKQEPRLQFTLYDMEAEREGTRSPLFTYHCENPLLRPLEIFIEAETKEKREADLLDAYMGHLLGLNKKPEA